jgi:hypothetical protein
MIAIALLTMSICAVFAGSASAHEFKFEVKPMRVLAEQTGAFTFESGGGVMTCKVAHFEATTSATSLAELKLAPTFTDCTMVGLKIAIKMNGCIYAISGATDKNEHGQLTLECGAGKQMEMVVGEPLNYCTAKFSSNTAANGVHFTNSGSGSTRVFTATFTAMNLPYETSGKNCAFFGNGKDESLTGAVVFNGFEDIGGEIGKRAGIWVE